MVHKWTRWHEVDRISLTEEIMIHLFSWINLSLEALLKDTNKNSSAKDKVNLKRFCIV